jgi:hypothetical protein
MIAPRLRPSRASRLARQGPAKTTSAFFAQAAALIETPWAGAAIPDFVHPATRGKRPENFEALITFGLALGKNGRSVNGAFMPPML